MTSPVFAELAAKLLQSEMAERASNSASPRNEDRGTRALREALLQKRQRRRHRWIAVGCIGAIAASASVWGFSTHRSPNGETTKVVRSPETPRSWTYTDDDPKDRVEARELSPGMRLQANKNLTLRFPTGSEVRLAESSEVQLLGGGPVTFFFLHSGVLDARVAKLLDGERFLVRSGDSEFEVHGTRFEVRSVSESTCFTKAILTVSEGVVAARFGGKEERILAGETWPKTCAGASVTDAPTAKDVGVRKPKNLSRPTSTLSEENDIFARALLEKRNHAYVSALHELETLLERFPASPLRESAEAERMRILAVHDRSRATLAARRYLSHYPTGSAREEALALISERKE